MGVIFLSFDVLSFPTLNRSWSTFSFFNEGKDHGVLC